jgi:hypothetical protein
MDYKDCKLPPEVIDAQREYIRIKQAYGVCTNLTCTRMADPDVDRCSYCREKNRNRCQRAWLRKKEG